MLQAVRAIGIDPGASTGIACITLPDQSRDLSRAIWSGSFSVARKSERVGETHAESQIRHFQAIYESISAIAPHIVIIEEPADAMVGGWNKGKGDAGVQGRQTAFGVGAAYALALAAASCAAPDARIFSYLVAGSKVREGWMPKVRSRNLLHTMKHEQLAHMLALDAVRNLKAPERLRELSQEQVVDNQGKVIKPAKFKYDDELMAYGVLRYHISTHGINVR